MAQKRKIPRRASRSEIRVGWRLVAAFLTMVAIALYANTLGHEFLFDDITLILQNPQVYEVDFASIFSEGGYRPLRTFTYALNFAAGGENPFGYHLVNVLLHAGNVLLALWFLFLLTRSRQLAFVGALLFAVHPVQTAAVAYVSGRKDLLAACFLLCGFGLWIKFREMAPGWRANGWAAVAFLSFILAILSKEVAIVFPVVLLAVDAVLESNRTILPSGAGLHLHQAVARVLRSSYLFYGFFLLLASAALYWAVFINSASRMEGYWGGSLSTNLGTAFKLFVHYLRLSLTGHPLIADYSGDVFPLSTGLTEFSTLGAIFLTAAFIGGAFWVFPSDRLVSLGLIWFVLFLTPVLQFIPFHELAADHFLYVPMVGSVLAGGRCFEYLLARRAFRGMAWVVLAMLVLLGSVRVFLRNQDWKDRKSLWEVTLERAPGSYRANTNLGQIRFQEGAAEEGLRLTRRAIELRPELALPRANLGAMFYTLGQRQRVAGDLRNARISLEQARNSLETALELEPDDPFIASNLGNAYKDLALIDDAEGRREQAYRARLRARDLYLLALRAYDPRPFKQAVWLNYGGLLIDAGEYAAAPSVLSNYVRAYPKDARGHYWIGLSFARTGKFAEAVSYLQRSGQLSFSVDTFNLLGYCFDALGQTEEAGEAYRTAVEGNPGSVEAHYAIGLYYSRNGDVERARQHLEKALSLDGNSAYSRAISQSLSRLAGANSRGVEDPVERVADEGN